MENEFEEVLNAYSTRGNKENIPWLLGVLHIHVHVYVYTTRDQRLW